MISSKKKKSSEEIELRSEKVRNLLGEIPPSIIRWGTVIIVAIFLILLLVICFSHSFERYHSQNNQLLILKQKS